MSEGKTKLSAKKKIEAATNLNAKETNNDILKYCNLSLQFEDDDHPVEETDLSAVGRQVRDSTTVINEIIEDDEIQSETRSQSKIPVPPPEIITFFKALTRPDMKTFIHRFLEHFDDADGVSATYHNHHCYENSREQSSILGSQSANQQQYPASQSFPVQQGMHQPQPSTFFTSISSGHFDHISLNENSHQCYESSILRSQSTNQQPYPASQSTNQPHCSSQSTNQQPYSTSQSTNQQPYSTSQSTNQQPYSTSQSTNQQPYSTSQSTNQQPYSSSQSTNQQPYSTSQWSTNQQQYPALQSFPVQQGMYQPQPSASLTTISSNQNQSQDTSSQDIEDSDVPELMYVRRTSPRKTSSVHSSVNRENRDSSMNREQKQCENGSDEGMTGRSVLSPSGKMVKIVEGLPYQVPLDQLRKLTSKARKDKRPGYAIVLKLMPLVFTTEEMALSRGQGIKAAKEGVIRPVLDGDQIKAIKAYADGYCKKNSLNTSTDSEMNIAVTEAVAYARKKKKKTAKPESDRQELIHCANDHVLTFLLYFKRPQKKC